MKKTIKSMISKTTKDDLKNILKTLRFYRYLKIALWKKWIQIFEQMFHNQDTYFVEYYPSFDKKTVLDIAVKIYFDVFQKTVSKSEITLFEKNDLEWWMRLYKNHEMIDMSLARVKHFLKA